MGTGLRVLFWAELFAPYQGGIEQLAARHVSAMQGCGHELVVVTSHDAEELPDEERGRWRARGAAAVPRSTAKP